MATHSKLPWKKVQDADVPTLFDILDCEDNLVAYELYEEIADFIILNANSHYQLLEACKLVNEVWNRDSHSDVHEMGDDIHEAWNLVRKALDLAEGKDS